MHRIAIKKQTAPVEATRSGLLQLLEQRHQTQTRNLPAAGTKQGFFLEKEIMGKDWFGTGFAALAVGVELQI